MNTETMTETQSDDFTCTHETPGGAIEREGIEGTEPDRDQYGRFNGRKPGPGRPKGCRNHKTLTALELRQRIVESWSRVDGDKLLDRLAKTDPAEYLRLVVKMLPAEKQVTHLAQQRIVFNVAPVDLNKLPRRELPVIDAPRLP